MVLCNERGQSIAGECYSIPGSLVPLLDRLEGAPHLFRLGPIALEEHPEGTWAYFYQQSVQDASRIASGAWEIIPDRHR